MVDYPPSEVVDMLMILGECRGNFNAAANLYRDRYPARRHPNRSRIKNLTSRARDGNMRRRQRTRQQYGDNDPRVLTLLALVFLNPQYSTREMTLETGIPRSTISYIFRKIKVHPYHITLTQALTQQDKENRVDFCQWAQGQLAIDQNFFKFVMFSDEACFHSSGHLNRHNCHYWSDTNPHWYRQIDHQHQWSLNVWCGIVNGYLIGPHFFDGTLNGEKFFEFLMNDFPQLFDDVDYYTRGRMWFQLDGAPPHFSLRVRQALDGLFPNKWIGRGGFKQWPARSPDITSPDFFLWGYLKDTVYKTAPTTKEDMIQRITNACGNIPRIVLLKSADEFERRIELCIQADGGNFEHL